jgi:hypothetical protein
MCDEYRTEDQSDDLKASVPITTSLGSRAQSDMVMVTDGILPPELGQNSFRPVVMRKT